MCPRCMSTNYQARIESSISMPWKSCPEGSTSPTSIVAAFLTCLVSQLRARVLLHHARMQQTAGVPRDSSEHQKALRSSRFDAECRRDRRSIDHIWQVSRWHTMLRFFSSLHQAAHFLLGYLMLCFFSAWTVVHKMSRYTTCVFFEQAIHLCVLLEWTVCVFLSIEILCCFLRNRCVNFENIAIILLHYYCHNFAAAYRKKSTGNTCAVRTA